MKLTDKKFRANLTKIEAERNTVLFEKKFIKKYFGECTICGATDDGKIMYYTQDEQLFYIELEDVFFLIGSNSKN
jgi:hypothetical protein